MKADLRLSRRRALALVPIALLGAACRSTPPSVHEQETTPPSGADPGPRASAAPAPTSAPIRVTSNAEATHVGTTPGNAGRGSPLAPHPGNELAAFAAGCFWGVEDAFRHVQGVVATAVGYTGGHTDNPTYPEVCTHTTGHAETVLVEFDPKRVPYDALVRAFFRVHDPTTPNRQGPDVGDQYRSAIFTFSEAQAATARALVGALQSGFRSPIVTEIRPIGRFYVAEDYHQQYAERTGSHGCPTGRLDSNL